MTVACCVEVLALFVFDEWLRLVLHSPYRSAGVIVTSIT